jgi:hypothetical protein
MLEDMNAKRIQSERSIEKVQSKTTTVGSKDATLNVFYSSAVEGAIASVLGVTHYSYRFAEAKFISLLTKMDYMPTKVDMPEYFADKFALSSICNTAALPSVHLIFRSTEEIRLLKCAYNIACFAWEFDVLKDRTLPDENPFRNQRRMLSLCQEVWVPSDYTKNVLQKYGIQRVRRIPAPVTRASPTRMTFNQAMAYLCRLPVAPLLINAVTPRKTRSRDAALRTVPMLDWLVQHRQANVTLDVYLTILNPQDHRKSLDSILRAFDYFTGDNRQSVLIVKLVTSKSRVTLADAATNLVFEELQGGTYLANPAIAFFSDYLSEMQMSALYSLADFYISASIAEGQNLPLQEAMLNGCIAISTKHTAMEDYLSARNCIEIDCTDVVADDPNLAGHISGKELIISAPTTFSIYEALNVAAALSSERRSSIAAVGSTTIEKHYGVSPVSDLVDSAFQDIKRHWSHTKSGYTQ